MTSRIGEVHLKRRRGRLVLVGMSKTPRGTRFIHNFVQIRAAETSLPEFKGDLKTAVEELMSAQPSWPPFRADVDDNRG